MARGRLVDKSIYTNLDLADIEPQARYLYIGMIVHADDRGRMKADPRFLKALIFPFDQATRVDSIKSWRDQLVSRKLITLYAADGREYLYHPNWEKWQPLRSDREKSTDCPEPDTLEGVMKSGIPMTDNGIPMTDNGIPMVNQCPPIPNLTEPNLTEPNLTEPNLKNIGIGGDFALPNWIPKFEWQSYLEMRKTIKKPLKTPEAINLAIGKLLKLKELGNNPKEVLEQSIFNSWQGLFELRKEGSGGNGHTGRGQQPVARSPESIPGKYANVPVTEI